MSVMEGKSDDVMDVNNQDIIQQYWKAQQLDRFDSKNEDVVGKR